MSRWVIDKDTLEVISGQDFVTSPDKLHLYDRAEKSYTTAAQLMTGPQASLINLTRRCSADLAPVSLCSNAATGKGYNGRIFLDGEEGGNANANRAMAWVVADVSAWELPAFGFGKINDMAIRRRRGEPARQFRQRRRDRRHGKFRWRHEPGLRLCRLQAEQRIADRKAGLTNGKIWSIAVSGVTAEDRNANIGLQKSIAGKGQGKPVSLAATNKGTTFLRPEDGRGSRNPNRYYFVTTDRNNFAADGTALMEPSTRSAARGLWPYVQRRDQDRHGRASDRQNRAAPRRQRGRRHVDNITIDKQGRISLNEDMATPATTARSGSTTPTRAHSPRS